MEKLKKTLNACHNRAISTVEAVEELIKPAKEMDATTKRGDDLGLTDDQVAFYDALAVNESAVRAMGLPGNRGVSSVAKSDQNSVAGGRY